MSKQENVEEEEEEAPTLEEEPIDVKTAVVTDDGPPILGPSIEFEGEGEIHVTSDDECDVDDDEVNPPDLEMNPPSKRRGRPKIPGGRKPPQIKLKLQRPPPARVPRTLSDVVIPKVGLSSTHFVKLFENGLDSTPDGDSYATVIPGCLTELLRKERIIELLTDPSHYEPMFQDGWMIMKPPRLPPLIADKGCFVFYVNGMFCKNAKDISYDDLRPWSSTSDATIAHSINIKPNVRRHPVAKLNGQLKIVKHETRLADYHLTEYSARLPREERLRKKIFYLTRNNCIYGNVIIIYNYVKPGNIPAPISLPHGNDLLRTAALEDFDATDTETPFENESYRGARGGIYLKLRNSKLGWATNKKQLLDYLINKPNPFGNFNVINHRLPDLPPLIESTGVFVYFVAAEFVINQIHHATDGLSPWTTIPGANEDMHTPRVRSTRKALVHAHDNTLQLSRDPKSTSQICLVETMSTLARCKRIRKRVFYVQNNQVLVGNVCYIYEFLCDGPLPELYPSGTEVKYSQASRWQNQALKKEGGVDLSSHMLTEDDEMGNSMLIPVDDEDIDREITEHNDMTDPQDQMMEEDDESLYPDMPPGGFDMEFNDDPIEKAENADPYYELARQLSTGHVYLTIRHKKLVCSMDHVLEWISNSNIVEERGLLNETKPLHPPLVTNSRAYAFFVAATAIFPHDINRDDFSPWSHNGNAENPVCYRTKVRKIGVVCDPKTSLFMLKDVDYKMCPFHMVYLYSINPKDPRLRKKIYYMMETQSKMVVSHALIVYDYNTEGHVVKINVAGVRQPTKKIAPVPTYEYLEDLVAAEENRVCPFRLPADIADDGSKFVQVTDPEFWNDRNRQIEFLVNQPALVKHYGILNKKIPDMPPDCTGKGTFAFFIDGEEVNYRSLTVDKLCPWSENAATNPNGVTKRPKSSKTPLGLNADNHLRVLKSASGVPLDPTEYQLHIYTATLPRAVRLRKKVVYIQQNGRPFGNALIMYSFTEHGSMPRPIDRYALPMEEWLSNLDETIQSAILHLMKTLPTPEQVSRKIYDDFGLRLPNNMLYLLKRQMVRDSQLRKVPGYDWSTATDANIAPESIVEEIVIEEEVPQAVMDHELMVEGEIIIESTEEMSEMAEVPEYEQSTSRRNPFLERNVASAGFVRGSQRYDALWRICQKHFGAANIDETFDDIFKLLYEKNEERLLFMINHTFNVDIYAAHDDRPLYDDHVHFMGDPNVMSLDEQAYLRESNMAPQRNLSSMRPITPATQEMLRNVNQREVDFESLSDKRTLFPSKKAVDPNQPGPSEPPVKPAEEDVSDAESEKIMI
ncbi:hypothetical protein CAEBREN_06499 [Caenorhabditis brenneri]|uniref:DUF7747 domain-containing protein n=1 Tax=Caenorhabditis brenneri TaxID=135651 RepID=G0N1X7_CAEBE|nr:hypothetical protein CAEBREN_06499 [Caenorhabditis brenneri]